MSAMRQLSPTLRSSTTTLPALPASVKLTIAVALAPLSLTSIDRLAMSQSCLPTKASPSSNGGSPRVWAAAPSSRMR
jgi:hypothetical protein